MVDLHAESVRLEFEFLLAANLDEGVERVGFVLDFENSLTSPMN